MFENGQRHFANFAANAVVFFNLFQTSIPFV